MPSAVAAKYIEVALSISRDEYLKLYQMGRAVVTARATDGRRVQFPAQALRPWVAHSGIQGKFRIYFDQQNRLSKIEPS